jgi:hypothetical protein
VVQLAELTENTKRGARGLILPAASAPGNPAENALLPETVAELARLGISPREIAVDGAFIARPDERGAGRVLARAGIHLRPPGAGSRRTNRRLKRYHTGAEGGISHLKRRYGLSRSRLKGAEGQRI